MRGGPGTDGNTVEATGVFAEKKGLTAVERGQLYHTVLQHLDLDLPVDTAGVMHQMETMAGKGIIDRDVLPA